MGKFLDLAVVMFHVACAIYAAFSSDTALTVFFCGMLVTYELIGIEQKLNNLLDHFRQRSEQSKWENERMR